MKEFIAQYIGGVLLKTDRQDYWVFSIAIAPFARIALPFLILFAVAARVLS